MEKQEDDAGSLLNRTRSLVHMRSTEPALAAHASFKTLYAENRRYPFVFLRSNGRHRMLVALNPSAKPVSVVVSGVPGRRPCILRYGRGVTAVRTGPRVRITMQGISCGLFRV